MGSFVTRSVRYVVRALPLVLMAWGFAVAFFIYGFLVSDRQWFPYETLVEVRDLALFVRNRRISGHGLPEVRVPASDVRAEEVGKQRLVVSEPVDDGYGLLLTGGQGQYLEYCPEHGCAAVILGRNGEPIQTYPHRPEELTTRRTVDLPYGDLLHDDMKDTSVFGLAPLPNGDLIVVYDFNGATPYGGGIARMDREGHLLWYRRDYSNHWPKLTSQNEILITSFDIGATQMPIYAPNKSSKLETITCASGILHDTVLVLDLKGQVKEKIPVLDTLLASPYWTRLLIGADPLRPRMTAANLCDPVHANSVVPVGAELAARLGDVEPDDLLLSLRNLSALVIIGRSDHAVKHMFTGTFIHQHSAQVLSGGKIILFDNIGSSPEGGPSRVLLYDPVTKEEKTIFPTKYTPKGLDLFSPFFGNIDISHDQARALVTISTEGKAYEIRLSDGAVLATLNNIHNLSSLPQFSGNESPIRYFSQFGVYYVSPRPAD